jgi:chromosome segregation ATPase
MPITNNKNPKNDEADKSHLDKLLENKPPEFQAKVLRFALDSGMKQDDPAFRLVQYIGYLSQLTETAPTEWKQLFKKLQGELSEWTELTAEQLATAADQSETINNLAQSCNRLSTALNALDLTSQQQLQQLTALSEVSPSLKNVVSQIPTLLKLLVNLNQTLSQNQILTVELSQSQMRELKREISIGMESRNLDLMRGEMIDLAQNQRRMMEILEQYPLKKRHKINPPGILERIWERLVRGALTWICSLDLRFI